MASDVFYTSIYLNDQAVAKSLVAGDIYKFRVTARNVVGDSAVSNTFSTMAASLPSAPGTPTRSGSDEASITIVWTAPTDDGGTPIFDYQILWDQGTGGSFVSLGSSSNELEFTPNYVLVTGYTYRFKVRAINFIGTGADSLIVSLISASPPDAPTKPLLYEASYNHVTITWEPVYNGGAPILGYTVQIAAVGSSSQVGKNVTTPVFTDITASGEMNLPNRRFTTASNLVTGTHYQFKIQAYNGVSEGGWSPESARIITALVPSVPQHLSKLASTKSSVSI